MLHQFFLVDPGAGMPRWCSMTDDGAAFVDFKGRSIPRETGRPLAHVVGEGVHATVTGVPPVVADMERRLAYRHLLDPWSEQGWLSPDGRLYGCSFFAHDDIAHALLRRSVYQLEEAGYVRVHQSSFRLGGSRGRAGPSKRQQQTLLAMGFEDLEAPGWRRTSEGPDRSLPPPRYAVRPPGFTMPAVPIPTARVSDLVVRLRGIPSLGTLLDGSHEIVEDVGGGNWDWLVVAGDLSVGGEDVSWLMQAPGLHLRKVAFDQVEVSHWPWDVLHVEPEAMALIEDAVAVARPWPAP